MQTMEYRHLSRREKKALENPNNRKHLKRAGAALGALLAEIKTAEPELSDLRAGINARLRKRARA